jgi:hypothetical protein
MMSERERLPDRRLNERFEFEHCYPGGMPMVITASISRFPDGRPAEVFADLARAAHKELPTDKQLSVDAHESCVIISFALQHGAALSEIGKALLHGEDGVPHGFMGALIKSMLEQVA